MLNRRNFLGLSLLAVPATYVMEKIPPSPAKGAVVVSTWDSGILANAAAWKVLEKRGRALDAVEKAGRAIEDEISCCVGLGALPDRDGKVTLDASIMDEKANCGSVMFLQRIKNPVSVARKLMETTPHVYLAGDGAQQFAIENGFELQPDKLSPESEKAWKEWLKKNNYKPVINIENTPKRGQTSQFSPMFFEDGSPNHDTMGTIAMDAKGDLSGMCTTSGLAYKMHGRVGDSPIFGSGLFVDNEVGAATATGLGEEIARMCGSHTIIESMRHGMSAQKACEEAVRRIVKRDPVKAKDFQACFIAIAKNGDIGAFAVQKGFSYAVTSAEFPQGKVVPSASYF